MRTLSDKQMIIALDVAPNLLSYDDLLNLAHSLNPEVRTLARRKFAQYILNHDIKDDQMAVYALKLLPVSEGVPLFDLYTDNVVRKVIKYLNGRSIQIDHRTFTTEDLQNALNLIDTDDYKLSYTEKSAPIIQLMNEKTFFFYLRKTPIEHIPEEENLNKLMDILLEENQFQEYIFSQDPYIVTFRNAVNQSPAIQEKVLEIFLHSNHRSFYYLACLAYIASGGVKEKWAEHLNKIFFQNVSSEFDEFFILVRELKWNDVVISFLLNSNASHLQMKSFYLMSFGAKHNDVIKSIDFSMGINDLAHLFKKLNRIEKTQLFPEDVEEIYFYKALVLDLFIPEFYPTVIDVVEQHLPLSLEGMSYSMMKCFYTNVFFHLSKEEQFKFLDQHWNEDECLMLLGFFPDEFVTEFMMN